MSVVQVQSLIEAGVHFGHRVSRWHPRMKPYIFGKRNLIHIVDIRETIKGLVRASNFLTHLTAQGKDVVFVGTKRQAKSLVQREAQRCGMHYVSERWLGGTLTNYHTIRSRLKRLEELEGLEKTGEIESYSKKRISSLRRERRKIARNLEGIRNMKQLPGCLMVVDIRREYIAVREARKMAIPVIGLVDTDCDPRDVDIVIPGNDDAYRAIQQILRVLTEAVIAGRDKFVTTQAETEKAQQVDESRAGAERAASPAAPPAAPSEPPRTAGGPSAPPPA
jgi:small subunit ribosomal protein S2